MPSRPSALAAARPAVWGAALTASSAALGLAAMAPRITAELMFGPVCSGHGLALQLHCPACYLAAAMAASGLGLLVLALPRKALSRR